MKTKRFSKKLVLNKNTVVNLEKQEMNAVKGGVSAYNEYSCFPCDDVSLMLSCDYTICTICI